MYPYFVRAYHHKDGTIKEIDAIYEQHNDAETELSNYIHMDEVRFAKVEKKYSPIPQFQG